VIYTGNVTEIYVVKIAFLALMPVRGLLLTNQGDTMKNLSIAILIATSALSLGAVDANAEEPTVTITVTAPPGTAGDDSAVKWKGFPWLPCMASPASLGGVPLVSSVDQLRFDLDVRNPDDDGDQKADYDLYVLFIDYSAPGNAVYALTPPKGKGFMHDTPTLATFPSMAALAEDADGPKKYRFMSGSSFIGTDFRDTLFGSAIPFDIGLNQGLWNVIAIMTRSNLGGTAAAASAAFQNPGNWAAWSMQPFVLGTPFKTALGTTGVGRCM
jgi:hypothetical protein